MASKLDSHRKFPLALFPMSPSRHGPAGRRQSLQHKIGLSIGHVLGTLGAVGRVLCCSINGLVYGVWICFHPWDRHARKRALREWYSFSVERI